jgi:hypothetical protein
MNGKHLAAPLTFSVYPRERDALLRIARERKLKSLFDVVRLLVVDTRDKSIKPEEFSPPKFKS